MPQPALSFKIYNQTRHFIIAKVCYQAHIAYCLLIEDNVHPEWADLPYDQQAFIVDGVKYLEFNPNATAEDLHGHWLQKKWYDGWRYGAEKDEEKKTDPLMCLFHQMPVTEQNKDHIFLSVAQSLISHGA